jgi:hypothetical protein
MGTTGFMTIFPEGGLAGNHDSAKATLGSLATDNSGNIYRYVLLSATSACAATAGSVAVMSDATANSWDVTVDVSEQIGTATGRAVGVFQNAVTAGYYGWVLVSGYGTVRTDNGVAAGDFLVPHSADHEADTMADGEEEQVFAQALTADTATEPHSCTAHIYCL